MDGLYAVSLSNLGPLETVLAGFTLRWKVKNVGLHVDTSNCSAVAFYCCFIMCHFAFKFLPSLKFYTLLRFRKSSHAMHYPQYRATARTNRPSSQSMVNSSQVCLTKWSTRHMIRLWRVDWHPTYWNIFTYLFLECQPTVCIHFVIDNGMDFDYWIIRA